jgi:hypothetical protein
MIHVSPTIDGIMIFIEKDSKLSSYLSTTQNFVEKSPNSVTMISQFMLFN